MGPPPKNKNWNIKQQLPKDEAIAFYQQFHELYVAVYRSYKDGDDPPKLNTFRQLVETLVNTMFREVTLAGITSKSPGNIGDKLKDLNEINVITTDLEKCFRYIYGRGNEGSHQGPKPDYRGFLISLLMMVKIVQWHFSAFRNRNNFPLPNYPEIRNAIQGIKSITQQIEEIVERAADPSSPIDRNDIDIKDIPEPHPPEVMDHLHFLNSYKSAYDYFIRKDYEKVIELVYGTYDRIMDHVHEDMKRLGLPDSENKVKKLGDKLIPKRIDPTKNKKLRSVTYFSIEYLVQFKREEWKAKDLKREEWKAKDQIEAAIILLAFSFVIDWFYGDFCDKVSPITNIGFSNESNEKIEAVVGKINRLNGMIIDWFRPETFQKNDAFQRTANRRLQWILVLILVALAGMALYNVFGRKGPPLTTSEVPVSVPRDLALIVVPGPSFARPEMGTSASDPKKWRKNWAQLIIKLSDAGAAVIVFDVELVGNSPDDEDLMEAINHARQANTHVVFVHSEVEGLTDRLKNEANCTVGFACKLQTQKDGRDLLPIVLIRKDESEFLTQKNSLIYIGVDRYMRRTEKGYVSFEFHESETQQYQGGELIFQSEDVTRPAETKFVPLFYYIQDNSFHCQYINVGDWVFTIPVHTEMIDRFRADPRSYFYLSPKGAIYNEAIQKPPGPKRWISLFLDKIVVVGVLHKEDKTEDGKYYGVELMAAGIDTLLGHFLHGAGKNSAHQ